MTRAIFEPLEPVRDPRRILFVTFVGRDGSIELSDIKGNSRRFDTRNADAAMLANRKSVWYSLVDPQALLWAGSGPEYWRAHKYQKRKSRMTYRAGRKGGGLQVLPASQFGSADPTAFRDVFDAIRDLGVRYGSFTRMTTDSWRRTLVSPLEISIPKSLRSKVDRVPIIGRREAVESEGTDDGRQFAGGLAYMDIPAAYLRSMREPIPTSFEEAEPEFYSSGIAEAYIMVPHEQGWNPLPISRTQNGVDLSTFPEGVFHGWWSFEELELAQSQGCPIHIVRAWKGTGEQELFSKWLEWALQIRTLPGASGAVAKQMTTRLWGTFGPSTSAKRSIVEFDENGIPHSRRLGSNILAKTGFNSTKHISAIVAARTRIELFHGLQLGAIWADTDGLIIDTPGAAKLEREGWKRKQDIASIHIYDWAHTRYKCMEGGLRSCPTCDDDSAWHYRISGMPEDHPDVMKAWENRAKERYIETELDGVQVTQNDFRRDGLQLIEFDKDPYDRGI